MIVAVRVSVGLIMAAAWFSISAVALSAWFIICWADWIAAVAVSVSWTTILETTVEDST